MREEQKRENKTEGTEKGEKKKENEYTKTDIQIATTEIVIKTDCARARVR